MREMSEIQTTIVRLFRLLTVLIVLVGMWAPPAGADAVPSAVLNAYRQRLGFVRGQIPQITAVAEVVAQRWVEKKQVLIHSPFVGDSHNFTMELCYRAGGIDNIRMHTVREEMRSANDVFIIGPRSWEVGGDEPMKEMLADARKRGWMIIIFGSKHGTPAVVPFDFLIDNGAKGGSEEEAALNQIVNITNSWIWCTELTAALTRRGYHPGIPKGMPVPGAAAHNKMYQREDGASTLYPCATPIPAGSLATAYLEQVERELTNLEGKAMQDQLARAAEYAVAHLNAGNKVWVSSNTHVLDGEVLVDNNSPFSGFRGISGVLNDEKGLRFDADIQAGDLLFFFGEWSLNLPWLDYLKLIRQTGADYIPSYRLSTEPTEMYEGPSSFRDQNIDDALMLLEQHWPFENAVAPIPFAPGKMAPISGIYVCLLYRMLDEKIAKTLAIQKPEP